MNTKILTSLAIIAVVAAAAIGGTVSYFSDTETSAGNTITAGVVDISLAGAGQTTTIPASLDDLKPGWTRYIELSITNENGSNPVDVWKKVYNIETSEGELPDSEQEWYAAHSVTEKNNINSVIGYDMEVDGEVVIDIEDGVTINDIRGYYMYLGRLGVGETMNVKQSYHMKEETGNWAQGDIMTFDIDILAQQVGAPAPGNALDFVNIGDPKSETGKDRAIAGWSNTVWPAAGGNWGGGDDGTVRTVSAGTADDTYMTTLANVDEAEVEIDFGNGGNWLYIRHLDGSTTDSFNVYVGTTLVGSYSDQYSAETWLTSKFDTTAYTGMQTVTIELTGAHWGSYDTWGQLGISWLKTLPL